MTRNDTSPNKISLANNEVSNREKQYCTKNSF